MQEKDAEKSVMIEPIPEEFTSYEEAARVLGHP
jgi:hypothetical protein